MKTRKEAVKYAKKYQSVSSSRKRLIMAEDLNQSPEIDLTVKRLLELFIEAAKSDREKGTVGTYETALARFPEYILEKKADALDFNDLERYKQERPRAQTKKEEKPGTQAKEEPKALKKRTVNIRLMVLSAAYKWAIRAGLLRKSQKPDIQLFKTKNPPPTVLTDSDLAQLYRAANSFQEAILTIGLETLARAGEIERIELRDVDFDRGSVLIRESKTGRIHTVPLGDSTRSLMKRFQTHRVDTDGKEHKRKPHQRRLVFCGEDGECLDPKRNMAVSQSMQRLKNKVNMPYFCQKTLRATGATRIAAAGGNAHIVQAMLGHVGLEMSIKYVNLVPEDLVGAKKALEAVVKQGKRKGLKLIQGGGA